MLRRYFAWVNKKSQEQIDKASIIMEDERDFRWLVYLTSATSLVFTAAFCGAYAAGFQRRWSWRKSACVAVGLFTTFGMLDTLVLRDYLIERRLRRYCYPAAAFFAPADEKGPPTAGPCPSAKPNSDQLA